TRLARYGPGSVPCSRCRAAPGQITRLRFCLPGAVQGRGRSVPRIRLTRQRRGEPVPEGCPLQEALSLATKRGRLFSGRCRSRSSRGETPYHGMVVIERGSLLSATRESRC